MPIFLKPFFHIGELCLFKDLLLSWIEIDYLVDLFGIEEKWRTFHFANELVHWKVRVDLFEIVDKTGLVLMVYIILDLLEVVREFITFLVETLNIQLFWNRDPFPIRVNVRLLAFEYLLDVCIYVIFVFIFAFYGFFLVWPFFRIIVSNHENLKYFVHNSIWVHMNEVADYIPSHHRQFIFCHHDCER